MIGDFTPEQKLYLEGFASGLNARTLRPAASSPRQRPRPWAPMRPISSRRTP